MSHAGSSPRARSRRGSSSPCQSCWPIGSSPRARSRPRSRCSAKALLGSAHPRVRGADVVRLAKEAPSSEGSSPRARSRPSAFRHCPQLCRLIPACAEQTLVGVVVSWSVVAGRCLSRTESPRLRWPRTLILHQPQRRAVSVRHRRSRCDLGQHPRRAAYRYGVLPPGPGGALEVERAGAQALCMSGRAVDARPHQRACMSIWANSTAAHDSSCS